MLANAGGGEDFQNTKHFKSNVHARPFLFAFFISRRPNNKQL